MNLKSQAAMEFLSTWGWALLVVLIVGAAMYYMDFFNPNRYLPEKAELDMKTYIRDFSLDQSFITLIVTNSMSENIFNFQINASECGKRGFKSYPYTIPGGSSQKIVIFCRDDKNPIRPNHKFASRLIATYDTIQNGMQYNHTTLGLLRATVMEDKDIELYYPLNNDVKDYSGNHNDAENNNVVQTDGIKNGGYYFDGVTSYLKSKDTLSDSNSVTISLWSNFEYTTDDRRVLFFDGDNPVGKDLALLLNTNDDIMFYSNKPSNLQSAVVYSNTGEINSGNFFHVVALLKQDKVELYLNGKLMASLADSYTNVGNHYGPVIGAARDNSGYHCCDYKGIIDEVLVWKKTLDPEQIEALYAAGIY